MAGVFLSYSRADQRVAHQVLDALRRIGIEVWWDQDMPGVDWQEELAREIAAMAAVAVIWTPNSSSSKHVRDEARLADNNEKLVNLLAGVTTPPFPFDRVNGLPIDDWDGVSPHKGWTRVVQTIEQRAVAAGAARPGEIMARLVESEQTLLARRAAVTEAEQAFHDAQEAEAAASDVEASAREALKRANDDLAHVRATSVGPAILRAAQQEYDAAEVAARAAAQALREARAQLSTASRTMTQAKATVDTPQGGVAPAPSPQVPVAEPERRPPGPQRTAAEAAHTPEDLAPKLEEGPKLEGASPKFAEAVAERAEPAPGDAAAVSRTVAGPVAQQSGRRAVPKSALFAGAGLIVALLVAIFAGRESLATKKPPFALAVTMSGDTDYVSSVAISKDGSRIVSGSWDQTVRIWDAAAGKEIGAPLTGHTGWVASVAFSPDGKRIVSGSWDETIRVWDAATGQEIGPPLTGHTGAVNSVAVSGDGSRIVSGSSDGSVRIWNAVTGKEIGPAIAVGGDVKSVAFSPDGRRFVSGDSDGSIRFWDAATGQLIVSSAGSFAIPGANSVAYSPDGSRVVSGSGDALRIWNANTGEEIGGPLRGHKNVVESVAFSPDGRRIVSGSDDLTIRVWDASSGRRIGAPIKGHTHPVDSVVFSPDGKRIVSGGDDTVRIWDASS